MTITAQYLLTELGKRAWSGFNLDDMIFSSEDSDQAKAELNAALRYLVNLEDFPFRTDIDTITTTNNNALYPYPSGQILSITNAETKEQLSFIGDEVLQNKTLVGKPESFWVNYQNPIRSIRLYPIPDNVYTFEVEYNQFMPVITPENEKQMEFTSADDFLNMPAHLEYLFMDCLVLRAIIQNNKDEQDENYRPTIDQFNECWHIFKRACEPVKINTRVIW